MEREGGRCAIGLLRERERESEERNHKILYIYGLAGWASFTEVVGLQ